MKEAVKLLLAGRSVGQQSPEIPDTSQLIDEPAIDQEADDPQKERLTEARAPSMRRSLLHDRPGDWAECKERGNETDTDAGAGQGELPAKTPGARVPRGRLAIFRAISHGDCQTASVVVRCDCDSDEASQNFRTSKPEAAALAARVS